MASFEHSLYEASLFQICVGIIFSVVFFQIVARLIRKHGTPKRVSCTDKWKWQNIAVSWIHAVIVGICDVSWYVLIDIKRIRLKTKSYDDVQIRNIMGDNRLHTNGGTSVYMLVGVVPLVRDSDHSRVCRSQLCNMSFCC